MMGDNEKKMEFHCSNLKLPFISLAGREHDFFTGHPAILAVKWHNNNNSSNNDSAQQRVIDFILCPNVTHIFLFWLLFFASQFSIIRKFINNSFFFCALLV